MEKTKKKKATNLTDALSIYNKLFSELKETSEMSCYLSNMNIKDSFALAVEEALNKPLQASYNSFIITQQLTHFLLNVTVIEFLKKHSNLLKEVYKANNTDNNILYYSILYKENNLTNRSKLRKFLDVYEHTHYYKYFDIYFQDIPAELEDIFLKELKTGKHDRII